MVLCGFVCFCVFLCVLCVFVCFCVFLCVSVYVYVRLRVRVPVQLFFSVIVSMFDSIHCLFI